MKSLDDFLKQAIVLVFQVPDLPVCRFLMPEHNFIGSQMLGRLFDARLKEAAQFGFPSLASGPLNSSITFFDVKDWRQSVPIIKSVLEENQLAAYAYIYHWDQSELVYRLLFPDSGPMIDTG